LQCYLFPVHKHWKNQKYSNGKKASIHLLHFKNCFCGIGRLEGNPFLFGTDKVGTLEIAVDKICFKNIGTYEAAVVKVCVVKSGICNGCAAVIEVQQFGTFKITLLNTGPGKGQELKITIGKIAGYKGGKIEKTHTHYRTGEEAHGKNGPRKIAAVKLVPGKIHAVKTHALGIEILDDLPFGYVLRYTAGFRIGIGRMDYTEG
jgi:hypothetical protein